MVLTRVTPTRGEGDMAGLATDPMEPLAGVIVDTATSAVASVVSSATGDSAGAETPTVVVDVAANKSLRRATSACR